MELVLILSLCSTILMMILSLLFKVAGKLRLTLPLLYFLAAVVSTFFTDWTSEHEQLVLLGLYILIGLVVLSWIVSLVKTIRRKKSEKLFEEDVAWQINRARELGVPVDSVLIDDDGTVLDSKTGQPLI
ncbi:hypothetical protein [Massiliimalia timonensis]|uniref:hypothetical protein n=1 Tax=Massiliimalia timonensis TaxID=1987501 RepID=UPI000B8AEBCE|nr:hypothetical protein [Massiliimalia timonensis]